ncbi:LysM peptidoglycan-binding domain-containing protein [Vicingus serpentipes]|uniref:LysM peptidoglycan-binding domain-containing protein n=1 Tax=Vicingus serpentipes TaxID=1926625 RepID=A0A5C6RWD6_9FLAO|nr:lytic transglycosylase domain-containing protein [Vicingus serpentipes]TXB66641.1 LysM peptidoglycan-binding domain-containing protein [Vicingus serpentipes]
MLKIKKTYLFLFSLLLASSFLIAQEESSYTTEFNNLTTSIYFKSLLKISDLNTPNPTKEQSNKLQIDSLNGDSILKTLENNFSLTYNSKVQEYINLYSNGKNIHFLNYLINYYSPNLITLLNKNNLPTEFLLIPAICSGFNPNSMNNFGGTGFWHLNYPQALKYGLAVNEYVDERKDINKSSEAALKYLTHLNSLYNNWELTLAAYSSGSGNINNLLNRHNASTYQEIYPYLNTNTRDIVPALQAMIYCYAQNNSNGNKIEPKLDVDTFYIEHQLQFKAIEDVAKINTKELFFYNPTLNKAVFPASFEAVFPKSKMDKFYQLCDSIYYYQDSVLLKPIEKPQTEQFVIPTGSEPITYTVKSGDVLGVIAEKYDVRVSQLQDWNNISGTRIDIGQKLLIYSKANAPSRVKETKAPEPVYNEKNDKVEDIEPSNEDYITYTVKSGDNLWVIAKKYSGISAQNIMDLNGIDGNLDVGQVLKIKKK